MTPLHSCLDIHRIDLNQVAQMVQGLTFELDVALGQLAVIRVAGPGDLIPLALTFEATTEAKNCAVALQDRLKRLGEHLGQLSDELVATRTERHAQREIRRELFTRRSR